MEVEGDRDEKAEAGGSGRCTGCSLLCAVCKIACFACCRRYICVCCCAPPPAPRPEISVLCLGVGPGGKSTLLAALSGENTDDIQPTNGIACSISALLLPRYCKRSLGFAIKAIVTPRAILVVKELGGSEKVQPYWHRYFSGHKAIIFVVDSTASDEQISQSRAALQKCLGDPALSGLPLLVLFHRQDVGGAKPIDELTGKMQLGSIIDGRTCIVKATSIRDVDTLRASFEQLVDCLMDN